MLLLHNTNQFSPIKWLKKSIFAIFSHFSAIFAIFAKIAILRIFPKNPTLADLTLMAKNQIKLMSQFLEKLIISYRRTDRHLRELNTSIEPSAHRPISNVIWPGKVSKRPLLYINPPMTDGRTRFHRTPLKRGSKIWTKSVAVWMRRYVYAKRLLATLVDGYPRIRVLSH